MSVSMLREAERLGSSGRPAHVRRILVVEDDDELRLWVAQILEESGYETISAPDVLSGIMALLHAAFDVVVTDWKMPGLDGMHLLHSIARLTPVTPVVFVTAYAEPKLREKIRQEGAFSLLEKPFRREQLLLHVSSALEAGSRPNQPPED